MSSALFVTVGLLSVQYSTASQQYTHTTGLRTEYEHEMEQVTDSAYRRELEIALSHRQKPS